ncbi:MAG: hypothetical protein KC420_06120, partial [Myxococcales bacterium]|nr:hypothetical protein [Myxococcales bacterium]
CKGLWARRSDLPAPAVFGLRALDDEEDAALVARALELVRPTPELAAMKSAYDARVVEYGDDAELPTWDAFVAANARATRWDEVGGPRRVVSFELYERPEECGDYFSEHVALLFEERGGALVRLDQPGWLGLEALMDLDRDGILEGIRREDLTTMVVAEGPNAAAFRDEFMIDYMGCRC